MTKTVPTYEKPLFDSLTKLYKSLSDLKNNRTRYISSKQVYVIYDEFLKQVHELTIVRKDEELKGMSLNLPNPSDSLIDDIWQLLSLSFVTCGLIKFAPATYSSLSTVSKLLTHLKECQIYSFDDLKPIKARLDEIKDIIDTSEDADDSSSDSDDMIDHKREESLLLRNKLNKCQQLYSELEDSFRRIPDDLEPAYGKLIQIRKVLLNYLTHQQDDSGKVNDKIEELEGSLKEIEDERDENGKFQSKVASESELHTTQIVLNALLDDCHNLIKDLSIQQDATEISNLFEGLTLDKPEHEDIEKVAKEIKSVYDELLTLRQTLENLLITRRWTMRETDLYTYQKALKRIDEQRLDFNKRIETSVSGPTPKKLKRAQLLVLYLLRRCYSLIYKLLESSEPVSESLQPIHNQLSTVRRCLLEIKRVDGLNNLRELYPFQFKLASLDNLRDDGKFIVNGQVPEGQGTLNALLAECFDIIHELKIELEEKEDNEDEHEGTENDHITDEEDKESDDEVELKRNRYVGFNEADYDMAYDSDNLSNLSDSEFESNDYY
ncbi:hypothetical protein FT663_01563 [Candidozyma haemuli var. vulneris]|uniref:Uncharacterized protein n=1 Tax=Candidozyma haemuli TaxID=45357 RepID=A0A2V1ASN8_9ASCO|nr:hypothetical protein CXQ85_002100 [[Candida] haemuloni]KAF3990718.1 hypothetical protein FT662_02141 [[Candida] haemuloni var. vulneris]KAF3994332.1 hypothetical protein FT663_01563 [[Candida] haemuloni var. vulneris]PVH20313.1 hypothetical protein CXQ85_002100 [[Candida] haemuloni]